MKTAVDTQQQSATVILARVSSKSQEDEGYSLDSQLKLLCGYCENKGLRVVKTFKIAETASKEQSRKVFHEMLAYISKNKVYHLAVEKTDRFTRNFRDAVAIDDWLDQDPNRRLHAVKENLLLHKEAKSDVKFMWNINLSVAKKYTDNLREEAMKGWAEKLAQGWLPGVPPPGYMTITESGKRIHIPNPDTKHLIQQAFKLYLDPNQSINSVMVELDRMGVRTRKGRPYAKSKVQKMLSNPFYIGINRHNGKEYPGAQEPLISKELFEQVQQKMHKGRPVVLKQHNPIFKNMITCNGCGGVVTWQKQKGRYYGACQRKSDACKQRKFIREDKIEAQVADLLAKLLCPSSEIIGWVADAMRKEQEDAAGNQEKLVSSIRLQIDRIQRMDDSLYDDKLSGDINQERYQVKHEQLMTQKAELTHQLSKLDVTSAQQLKHDLVLLELTQKAGLFYAKKTPEQKRFIMTKLFTNVSSGDAGVSVTYTEFARAIAENVQLTHDLLGE
ncbi:MAG TPA: recombinase family protein [Candidatus Chromulinivoraceae bacterium]|nr:recombinase family protein [Candidatus Chromulinivoraceae bacterium]